MEKRIRKAWKEFHKMMKSGRLNKVVKLATKKNYLTGR